MTTGSEHRQDGVLVRAWLRYSEWRPTNEYVLVSRLDDGSLVERSIPVYWDRVKADYRRAEGPEARWVLKEGC